MIARVGGVIYRKASIFAVLWVAFVFLVTATFPLSDWTIATPIAGAGALIIWTVGWAVRYVLTGVELRSSSVFSKSPQNFPATHEPTATSECWGPGNRCLQ